MDLTKISAFVAAVLSLTASAQTGASVCGSILMGDERVRCMQAIAGHSIDPGAASVCATILMGNDKAACLQGAIDKRYQPDELSACRGILMGNEKAACIAASGALPQVQQPVVAERRRSRRDDDDDEEEDRPSRRSRRNRNRRDDDDDDVRERTLRLTNYHAGSVSRFYYRRVDARRFTEIQLPALVVTNTYQDIIVPSETIETCVETPDGFRLYWQRVKRADQLTVVADEPNWAVGRCRDLR
jgi:hypothetical protein